MVQMLRGSTAAATATTADTYVAKAMPGGIVYHQSGSGDKMEQMRHENPGEVWESFQNRMIRQSLASVWPAALVWMSAGQGTAERSEIIKARGYIRTRQRDLTTPALQAFAWAYSVFQQQGRVPELDHPFSWEFSKPARLSVDDGRESKMELEEWRAGARNMGQIQEAHGGAGIEEFYLERAHEAALRKVIARRVSEEYSASSGYEIKVEDREMALITPNEVPPPETSDSPEKENQPDKDKQDEDSDT
jgi:hypothetical protein